MAPQVWLAYVSYPVTTAAYLERALRRAGNVLTIGPSLPERLIRDWDLEAMKLPVTPHDIPTSFTPDMREVIATRDSHPDLYLWVESVSGYRPLNVASLRCPKACYFLDTHLHLDDHLEWARQFDFVFVAHKQYVGEFTSRGMRAYWLPVGCDREIHQSDPAEKLYEVGFVGTVEEGSRRAHLLRCIEQASLLHRQRCFWREMVSVFAQSRIVFNSAVNHDLNMRFFEAMSSGTMLMSDLARESGQAQLFSDGEDYAVYSDHNVVETAQFYLENSELREQIAHRGRMLVHNAHTYDHRVDDLLHVVLGGKKTTFTAEELRGRSLPALEEPSKEPPAPICISQESRSFVIPVLDLSPASPFNVGSLLKDLESIRGDVIVIFNSEAVAEQLKSHPRITYHAVMSKNVGVSRAWNIGLNIALTPTVFILNADLHIEKDTIETLEATLNTLDHAACTGPQGDFYDFNFAKDLYYFDKGSFSRPIEVDAVSGFLFAVKREHFEKKILKFENEFTPCWFEEWDLGLQIKKAGLKSWIVPTTGYSHEWSGTIGALREIAFYNSRETKPDILRRNRKTFLSKWRHIARTENVAHILESGWKCYGLQESLRLIRQGGASDALELLHAMRSYYVQDEEIDSLWAFALAVESKGSNTLGQVAGKHGLRLREVDIERADSSSVPRGRTANVIKLEETDIERLERFLSRVQGEAYAEAPSELHVGITRQMVPHLFSKFPLPPDSRILDVGCGQGIAIELLAQSGADVIGITLNQVDAQTCRAKGYQVLQMEQSFLRFPDAHFDLIWCRHCLEHSVFPFFTLAEFNRVLRCNGLVYIEVPAPDTTCRHQTNVNHYSVLGKSMWMELITRSGFVVLDDIDINFEVPDGPDTYWAWILRKPGEGILLPAFEPTRS